MKTIFVDETDKQANAKKRRFFCICGLVVDDTQLISASNALESIKEKYGLSNLKDARKAGLDEETRVAITKEVCDCLATHQAKVIGIILGDFSMSFDMPNEDVYMGAMSFLMERFSIPLMKSGGSGIVVLDSVENTLQNQLRRRFYDFIRTDAVKMHWQDDPLGHYRDHVSPVLHFVDDEHCTLVQAVDLVATSLNSAIVNTCKEEKLNIDIESLPTGNKFLEIYWPLFDRSSKGKVAGWGIKVWD